MKQKFTLFSPWLLKRPDKLLCCWDPGLVNWYDGGQHSIGAHSDDEKGLTQGLGYRIPRAPLWLHVAM